MAERVCKLCGGPIRGDNAFGICQANGRCDRARQLARRERIRGARRELLARLAAGLALLEARREEQEVAKREAQRARYAARKKAERERRAALLATSAAAGHKANGRERELARRAGEPCPRRGRPVGGNGMCTSYRADCVDDAMALVMPGYDARQLYLLRE